MRAKPITPVQVLLIIIIGVPLLGTFFPVESYLAAPTLANPLGTPLGTSKTTTISLIVLYAIVVTLWVLKSDAVLNGVRRNWLLLVFVAWTFVTALWAEDTILSINRSGRLLLGFLFGLYIAEVFDRKSIVRILFYSVMIGIIGSAVVTAFAPSLSRVVDARGAYRGAFSHKNVLGSVSSFGMLFSSYAFSLRIVPGLLCSLVFLTSAVLIILANSVTALLALMLAGGLALYLRFFGSGPVKDRVLALLIGTCGASVFAVVFAIFSTSIEFAGRDASLTGRTDVWDFVNVMIDMKPIWGWGHGTWNMPSFSSYVLAGVKWPAPHAHNSWLDFRLQLGIPGLVLAILCAMVALRRCVIAILTSQDPEYLLWIAVIVFQGIRCSTETMFVDPAAGEFIWFTLASARLGRITSRSIARAPSVKADNMSRSSISLPANNRYAA